MLEIKKGRAFRKDNNLICVLDGNSRKIDSMELNGFGATFLGTSKPSSYTLAGGSSGVWVYSLPAITDASLRVGSLYVGLKAGQAATGTQWGISCMSKENFIDTTANSYTVNAFAQKVAEPNIYFGIEDSSGTSKSLIKFSFIDTFI